MLKVNTINYSLNILGLKLSEHKGYGDAFIFFYFVTNLYCLFIAKLLVLWKERHNEILIKYL